MSEELHPQPEHETKSVLLKRTRRCLFYHTGLGFSGQHRSVSCWSGGSVFRISSMALQFRAEHPFVRSTFLRRWDIVNCLSELQHCPNKYTHKGPLCVHARACVCVCVWEYETQNQASAALPEHCCLSAPGWMCDLSNTPPTPPPHNVWTGFLGLCRVESTDDAFTQQTASCLVSHCEEGERASSLFHLHFSDGQSVSTPDWQKWQKQTLSLLKWMNRYFYRGWRQQT